MKSPDNKHSNDQRKKRMNAKPLTHCWVRANYDRTSDVTALSHWNNESSKPSNQSSKLSSFSITKVFWAAPYNVELCHAAPKQANIITQAHFCSLPYFWLKPRIKRICMSAWICLRKNLIALNKNILKKTEIILIISIHSSSSLHYFKIKFNSWLFMPLSAMNFAFNKVPQVVS